MSDAVRAVLVGAGQRGHFTYGRYALDHPDALRFVAVVDPSPARIHRFGDAHGIPAELRFATVDDYLAANDLAGTAFVATPDRHHHAAAIALLEAGHHLYLEKPIATNLRDAVAIVAGARKHGRLLHVAHVLRYTPFFKTLHDIVTDPGTMGDLITVEHRENVVSWHMAHSFVRGNWARAKESSPMIVAKSCHDFDLLQWNLARPIRRLASFGSLLHFNPDRAPEGATERCTDPCPVEDCPFDARRLYLNMDWTGWPIHVIADDLSYDGRLAAITDGPYGRCVYRCGSDVVDHQVVSMECADGVSATLTMHGHSHEEGRTMRFDGSRATVRARFTRDPVIEVIPHHGVAGYHVDIPRAEGGHGGGDTGAVRAFLDALASGRPSDTTGERALEGYYLAFAAETARREGRVIDMAVFRGTLDEQ